jgi:hypothetical protein
VNLSDHFHAFLENTVNIDATRLGNLDSRVDTIYDVIRDDAALGDRVTGKVPHGSWAHRTIIRPVDGDEFDADFLVCVAHEPDWDTRPARYVEALHDVFDTDRYRDKRTLKNRCVRIQYAGECHVDIVPLVDHPVHGQCIVMRTADSGRGEWERTNPAGFTSWLQERDDRTNGRLRRVLRLLKYMRDSRGVLDARSVLITLLAGEAVTNSRERYGDMQSAFVAVLEDLDIYMSALPTMPPLVDPSRLEVNFRHRWTEAKYQTFKTDVAKALATAHAAAKAPDSMSARVEWQRLFGDGFRKPDSGRFGPVAATPARPARAG